MGEDPRLLLAQRPMHPRQMLAIVVAVALNALDGFDVYAISFAAPSIAAEWSIEPGELGVVLAMDMVGLGVGAFGLGMLADRIGRRPAVLASICLMAIGMLLAALAPNVLLLSIVRLVTGLGIGGLLASCNAVVAEYANDRWRSFAIVVMVAGFAVGAAVGGGVAAILLETTGYWQSIFAFGALVSAAALVPALLLAPETISYLWQSGRPDALQRVNRILVRFGHPTVAALPPRTAPSQDARDSLFERGLVRRTVVLTTAFSMQMVSFYFLMKWIPKIVTDLGYAPASAAGVLVWAHVGGAAGTIALSALSLKFGVRPLVVAALLAAGATTVFFGRGFTDLVGLSAVAGLTGLVGTGAIGGLYAVVTQSYPTRLRASSTGFVIGVGRAGAAAGPIAAGLLFAAGWPLGWVAAILSLGSVVAALVLLAFERADVTARSSPGVP